jgi:hypothetical protein
MEVSMSVRKKIEEVFTELCDQADEAKRNGHFAYAAQLMTAASYIVDAEITLLKIKPDDGALPFEKESDFHIPDWVGDSPAHYKMNGVYTP